MKAIQSGKVSVAKLDKIKKNKEYTHDPTYLHNWFVRLASLDWYTIHSSRLKSDLPEHKGRSGEDWYQFEKDINAAYISIMGNFDSGNQSKININSLNINEKDKKNDPKSNNPDDENSLIKVIPLFRQGFRR